MTKMPVSPKAAVKEVQDVSSLAAKAFASMFRRPFYVRDILTQMDIVGVGSLTVVMLTGFFTGAVLTLQSSKTLTDRKSTRLNSSHPVISYAVFCLKKKKSHESLGPSHLISPVIDSKKRRRESLPAEPSP